MTSKWLTDEKVDSVFSSVYLTGMLIVTMLTSMITGIIRNTHADKTLQQLK
jgi:hypothetical protein